MKNIKIYYTSDTHGYLLPTDYMDKSPKAMGVLSIAQAYKKGKDTLVIDCGDTLQGSPFALYYSDKNGASILAEVMNKLNIDYYTLGNHDFNYGYDYLKEYIIHNRGTLLCANVEDVTGEIEIKNYDIKTMENGLKIGIVGITTDWTNTWEKPENLLNFKITDPYTAASNYLEEIKTLCDVTICLYHGGFEIDLETLEKVNFTGENIGGKIVKTLDYDILLTGHQHRSIENIEICGTHIVQPMSNGKGFGEINVSLENISSKIKEPAAVEIDERFLKYDQRVQKWLDEPIAVLEAPLVPRDRIEMALEGSELADLFNKIQLHYSNSDISIVSLPNEYRGLMKNTTIRDIIMTYKFSNILAVIELSGADLKAALEKNYEYIKVEDGVCNINPNYLLPKREHYNFDFFKGVDFTLEILEDKILVRDIMVKDEPLKEERIYTLTLSDYRLGGAGGFYMYSTDKVIKYIQRGVRDLIIEYLSDNYS